MSLRIHISSSELQRMLRRAYNDKLTGHIALERWVDNRLQYSTLTFLDGQLLKAKIRDYEGRRALELIADIEFDKVSIVHTMVDRERDTDLPHLATLLEENISTPQTRSPSNAEAHDALVTETLAIIQRIYGDKGARKVHEIIAKLPPASNPSLFLDRCEELLVPMFGQVRARELIRGAY